MILQVLTLARRAINFAEVLNDVGRRAAQADSPCLASARSAQGLDAIECRAKPVLLDLEVVAGLQVYPEPLRGAEVAGESQCRVALIRRCPWTISLIRLAGTLTALAS